MKSLTNPMEDTYRVIPLAATVFEEHDRSASPEVHHLGTLKDALTQVATMEPEETPHAAVVGPAVILNHRFFAEVATAIADPGLAGLTWIALASDGIDITGHRLDAGNFLDDPAMANVGPLRIARWADPAVAVIDVARLRNAVSPSEVPDDFGRLVAAAAERHMPVFISPWLRYSSLMKRDVVAPSSVERRGFDLLHDLSPSTVRDDPSISIVIRTTLERPAMLRRNLAAIAAEHARSGIFEILLTSTASEVRLASAVAEALRNCEALPLRVVHVAADGTPSRVAAMMAALDAARGDYVWYVDDDDWITSGSVERIKEQVHALDRPILVGAVEAFDEEWTEGEAAGSVLNRRYLPEEWYRAFTGWNFLPNCSIVIPRTLAMQRVASSPLTSDLGEDYALQLLLFTTPGSTVQVIDETIANVSWRSDGDNVVAMKDRTPWLRDLSSHMSDLSRDPAVSTEAFWRLGRAVRELPYPSYEESRTNTGTASEAVAQSESGVEPLSSRTIARRLRHYAGRIRSQMRRSPDEPNS